MLVCLLLADAYILIICKYLFYANKLAYIFRNFIKFCNILCLLIKFSLADVFSYAKKNGNVFAFEIYIWNLHLKFTFEIYILFYNLGIWIIMKKYIFALFIFMIFQTAFADNSALHHVELLIFSNQDTQ